MMILYSGLLVDASSSGALDEVLALENASLANEALLIARMIVTIILMIIVALVIRLLATTTTTTNNNNVSVI